MAADPAATAAYYKPWTEKLTAGLLDTPACSRSRPKPSESLTGSVERGGRPRIALFSRA